MKPITLIFALLPSVALAQGPAVSDRNAAVALQERCFDAFVRVRSIGNGTGSGVFIHSEASDGEYDNYVLTAYHVVDDGHEAGIAIDTVNSAQHGRFIDSFDAELVSFDEDADVAVLKVRMPARVTTLKLATARESTPANSPVLTIGCSNAAYPTVWSDTLRGTTNKLSAADWQAEKEPIPGRSGGPLICVNVGSSDYSRVLGVCIRINPDGTGIYSDLEATRSVVESAGLPSHVVNGHDPIPSPRVLYWLVFKLAIAVIAQATVRVR